VDLGETLTSTESSLFQGYSPEAEDNYRRLSREGYEALALGRLQCDPHLLNPEEDRRSGVSLILRPAPEVVRLLARVSQRLLAAMPDQYFYQESDYHVTVATLVAARDPLDLGADDLSRLRNMTTAALASCRPFLIHFLGVSLVPAGIIARGYYPRDSLAEIRDAIRAEAKQRDIPLQERHSNVGAHVTVARFRTVFDTSRLVTELDALQRCELGLSPVHELDLVQNDWYTRKSRVRVLERHLLRF